MRRRWFAALVIGAPAALFAATAGAEDTRPLSEAQTALFESNHFKNIDHAERLEYRFQRETTAVDAKQQDAGFSDRIDLDVRPREDGKKDVWVDFLSGAHHVPYPPLMGFNGNPVLMFFLEHDVTEMNQRTGGAALYFRNRIRQAFVDKAEVKTVDIERAGATLRATEITLVPFKDDPNLKPFPGLSDKRYRFLLSDAVPGSIYEVDATVPGAASDPPRIKESMIFDSEKPCAGGEGPCAPPESH
jgi:hypothetical protein